MSKDVTPEWLSELHRGIGRLLMDAEIRYGDNPAGTYPSDVEMTLRLAWMAAGRALTAAGEAPLPSVSLPFRETNAPKETS